MKFANMMQGWGSEEEGTHLLRVQWLHGFLDMGDRASGTRWGCDKCSTKWPTGREPWQPARSPSKRVRKPRGASRAGRQREAAVQCGGRKAWAITLPVEFQ